MDLSKLSDADLQALSAGNLSAMSEAGFAHLLVENEKATPRAAKEARTRSQMAEKYAPTVGMTTGELLAAGAGKAVSNAGMALQQLAGGVSRADVDEMRRRDAPLMDSAPGRVGYVAGAVGSSVPLMMAPGAGTVAGAAMLGAAQGAATPLGTGEDVLPNAAFGALGGAVPAVAAKAARFALAPSATPEAQALASRGVQMTPGQQMGGGWQRAEAGATSVPVLGDTIKTAQRKAIESFNTAVANVALAPIGQKLPKGIVGEEAVAHVEKAIGSVYESALKRAGPVRADSTLAGDLGRLGAMVRSSPMPDEVKAQFMTVVKNQITGKFTSGPLMPAKTFKAADSELGRLASLYMKDPSADKRMLGDALEEAQAIMRQWLERSVPQDVAQDISAANASWAQFKRMQHAAAAQGSRGGVFSPEAYRSAVRALDQSKDKGAFARGDALGKPLANDAIEALGSTVPDSGTPFRSAIQHPWEALIGAPLYALPALGYSSPRALSIAQTILSGQRPALATRAAAELEMAAPALSALGMTGVNVQRQLGAR